MLERIDWALLATFLGSLATAASVIFAYYQFKASADQKFFSEFRLALIDLRNDARELDGLLSEQEFAELGYQIAKAIDEAFSTAGSTESFLEEFDDKDNQNLVVQAIYMGHQRANLRARMFELMRRIERVPPKYRESFPVSMSIIQDILRLFNGVAKTAIEPGLFIKAWLDEETRSAIISELKTRRDKNAASLLTGSIFASMSSAAVRDHGQDVIDTLLDLSGIIVENLAPRNDGSMSRVSRNEKRLKTLVTSIDNKTVTADIIDKFKLNRHQFSEAEWDLIVSTHANLASLYSKMGKR